MTEQEIDQELGAIDRWAQDLNSRVDERDVRADILLLLEVFSKAETQIAALRLQCAQQTEQIAALIEAWRENGDDYVVDCARELEAIVTCCKHTGSAPDDPIT